LVPRNRTLLVFKVWVNKPKNLSAGSSDTTLRGDFTVISGLNINWL